MTSPMVIVNYLNLSKLLLSRSDMLRFRHLIPDCMPKLENDIDLCMYIYRSHRMNFDPPIEGRKLFRTIFSKFKQQVDAEYKGSWKEYTRLLKDQIEQQSGVSIYEILAEYLHMERGSYNIVSDSKPLAMPYIIQPHLESGKFFLAYAGVLDYFDMVYFTGDNLMEAYAMVNEYVSKGESIPEYDVSKREANRYWGVFEVYRRMHSHRYSNEKDLAISFLAIVDICFTTDPLTNHSATYENDEDFRHENVSIPYRFGKLIYRAQGFRPFTSSNETTLPNDIEMWQDDFCNYQGFYALETCIKHTISELIFILIYNFVEIGYHFSESVYQILEKSWMDDCDWKANLESVVEALNDAYIWKTEKAEDVGISTQSHMVLSFINALIYKLHNRGKVVVSALYADEIRCSIEPAAYVVGGQYAYNYFSAQVRTPLNDNSLGIWEPIENMVLKNMALTGVPSCGFMESFYPCRYTENGYGCPLVGLTSEECEKRKRTMIPENWCHYTRLMNILTVKDEQTSAS